MISVIIPTHNRKEILVKLLKALFHQSVPKEHYEIVVVDDGSTDGTETFIQSTLQSSPVEIRYFSQSNKGPAAARNLGIRQAKGDIVVIIGDDISVTSTFIEEHEKSHSNHTDMLIGILGYITWSPELTVTPFMHWLENGGPQFSYYQIEQRTDVTDDIVCYFYTSNISFKKKLFENYGFFDEEFPYAAFEDTELGFRLRKAGLRLLYNKKAIAYHYHPMTLESVSRRMQKVGESMHILFRKQPDIIPVMKGIFPELTAKNKVKQILLRALYPIASLFNIRKCMNQYYGLLMMQQLWIGYRRVQNHER